MNTKKSTLLNTVKPLLKGESAAVMLFGSVARGDSNPASDVDILQLTNIYIPSYKVGKFNISVYTVVSLRKIAKQGSLFVLHLLSEGVILEDKNHVLSSILSEYAQPNSYDEMLANLKVAVNVLNVSEANYIQNWKIWNGVAMFVLRSTLYAIAAKSNRPLFAISRIAKENNDDRIIEAWKIKYANQPQYNLFCRCGYLALEYLQSAFCTPPDSLAVLMSGKFGHNPLLESIVGQILGRDQKQTGAYR